MKIKNDLVRRSIRAALPSRARRTSDNGVSPTLSIDECGWGASAIRKMLGNMVEVGGIGVEVFLKFTSVVGAGIIELLAAISAGLALGLHLLLTGIASAMGSIVALVLVVFLGDRIKNWVINRRGGKKIKEENSRIYRVWNKYGVIGLGMLSPLLTGAPLGAAIGISLGVSPSRLIMWMVIGITVWTIILTMICALGLLGFEVLTR